VARNDGNESNGGLGNSYPALWKSDLTPADEHIIKLDCYITKNVVICFDTEGSGVVVRSDRNEVCLYEAMFLAGLRLPFPRLVRELLNYLNLGPTPDCSQHLESLLCQCGTLAQGPRRRTTSYRSRVHVGI
jgi:hypothetical protein